MNSYQLFALAFYFLSNWKLNSNNPGNMQRLRLQLHLFFGLLLSNRPAKSLHKILLLFFPGSQSYFLREETTFKNLWKQIWSGSFSGGFGWTVFLKIVCWLTVCCSTNWSRSVCLSGIWCPRSAQEAKWGTGAAHIPWMQDEGSGFLITAMGYGDVFSCLAD